MEVIPSYEVYVDYCKIKTGRYETCITDERFYDLCTQTSEVLKRSSMRDSGNRQFAECEIASQYLEPGSTSLC